MPDNDRSLLLWSQRRALDGFFSRNHHGLALDQVVVDSLGSGRHRRTVDSTMCILLLFLRLLFWLLFVWWRWLIDIQPCEHIGDVGTTHGLLNLLVADDRLGLSLLAFLLNYLGHLFLRIFLIRLPSLH